MMMITGMNTMVSKQPCVGYAGNNIDYIESSRAHFSQDVARQIS